MFPLTITTTDMMIMLTEPFMQRAFLALLLSGSIAIGVILLSALKGYQGEIQRYLFGDVLAIGWEEVGLSAVLFFVVGAGIFVFLNGLSLITLQQEMAQVCGIPVRALN